MNKTKLFATVMVAAIVGLCAMTSCSKEDESICNSSGCRRKHSVHYDQR